MRAVSWAALDLARCQRVPRTPVCVDGLRVGSVADAHLGALTRWPQWLAQRGGAVHLQAAPDERGPALAEVNARLREDGLIVAWRNETYAIVAAPGAPALA